MWRATSCVVISATLPITCRFLPMPRWYADLNTHRERKKKLRTLPRVLAVWQFGNLARAEILRLVTSSGALNTPGKTNVEYPSMRSDRPVLLYRHMS